MKRNGHSLHAATFHCGVARAKGTPLPIFLFEMYPLIASDGRFHACFFVVHPPPEKAIMTPSTSLQAFRLSDIQPTPANGSVSLRN
mmetsp:Transcript_36251/g.66606  ORF Transcript_36251/g.66606 Transcript_36251/m.66606 type:complete len:86 (-) Transcript_36251:532-789(-)